MQTGKYHPTLTPARSQSKAISERVAQTPGDEFNWAIGMDNILLGFASGDFSVSLNTIDWLADNLTLE